jgi:hypothetical protein
MWKRLRIAILLLILASVAVDAARAHLHATDWTDTLHVALYPINADGSTEAARAIAALDRESFADIDAFFATEAQRYGKSTLRPVHVTLQPPLKALPPPAPSAASAFDAMLWSLKLRFWAWRQPSAVPRADVRLYALYWGADKVQVPASHGLRQGQIGVVHLYAQADMARGNSVVLAHELAHTLGATDKYEPATLLPLFPEGYAEPEKGLPQSDCELMAGRTPVRADRAEQPDSLARCRIGRQSAREIGLSN